MEPIILSDNWQIMNATSIVPYPKKSCTPIGLRFWAVVACLFLATSFGSCIAHADSGAGKAVATEQSSARLVTAVSGTGNLPNFPAGLEIDLKPGWKTYWRAPGDAGFAPELTFVGSENLAAAKLAYPTPHRFELFGLQTFGYKDQVVYPIAVTPKNPGAPVGLKAHLRYLVCAEVCIPYEADLALDIPAGPATPSGQAPLINRFQAMVPGDGRTIGLSLTGAAIDDAGKLVIKAASSGQRFTEPDVIVEGPSGLQFGKPDRTFSGDGETATLTVPITRSADPDAPVSGDLTLTVIDGDRGFEQHARLPGLAPGALQMVSVPANTAAPVAAAPAPPSVPAEDRSLWLILGIAVLGGLILNVMPCVLPVLILKLTSVLAHGGGEHESVRGSFLATAAGIVAAFLALAAALAGLKLAGHEIGWGIQFQQPVFLAVLAIVCLVFAANLWGLFEVPLPAMAGDLALAADRRASRHKILGAFLTGIFATVLATPCSAPFVGTAIGFALARQPADIFAIFLAMSVGLALPYLAVALVPHLAVMLPRPGRWMVWLKKLLGVSMTATAAWLVWVLAGQVGLLHHAASADQASGEAVHWQRFDEAAIPGLVASGKTVFVDVTADWCLTCKANKTLVIDRDPVRARLDGGNVVAMVADWTKPNPVIDGYLAKFGRYGIPLNVVYGAKAPQGIALPELLSADSVLHALDSAGDSTQASADGSTD
jgi:suppressor for copper-sensitivity B